MKLTVEELVERFEQRVRALDRKGRGIEDGAEPCYPFIVFFLGEESCKSFEGLARRLFQLWPAYTDDLRFFGVSKAVDGFGFTQLSLRDGAPQQEPVDERRIGEMVMQLFSAEGQGFADRSSLLVYNVLDTSAMESADEFAWWAQRIPDIGKALSLDIVNPLTLNFVLLDEGINHHGVSGDMRRCLATQGVAGDSKGASVMLLSNAISNSTFTESFDPLLNIVAACILLSNSDDFHRTQSIFGNCMETVSYARIEKPIHAMGLVTVKKLLGSLSLGEDDDTRGMYGDPAGLARRLGITAQGTLQVVEDYVAEHRSKLLPTAGQLALFPRVAPEGPEDVSQMTSESFDSLTMGSWGAYLRGVAESLRDDVTSGGRLRDEWLETYEAHLHQEFSVVELASFMGHKDEIASLFGSERMPRRSRPVLEGAAAEISQTLSDDAAIRQLFVDAVYRQSQLAKRFIDNWDELMMSGRRMHGVRKNDVSTNHVTRFYEKLTQDLLDLRGEEITRRFKSIRDDDEMDAFFDWLLGQLVNSSDVFEQPFEQELNRRLSFVGEGERTQETIRGILTGSGVPTYFRTGFALDAPVLQAMLMREGSELQRSMRHVLPETTDYYDTGQGIAAEALNVFRIDPSNLQ